MANHPPKKFKRSGGSKVKSLKPSYRSIPATNLDRRERVILDTLKYRQIFGCPMTIFQIGTYLLTIHQSSKHSPDNPVDFVNAVDSTDSVKVSGHNNIADSTKSVNFVKPSVMSPQEFKQALDQLVKSGIVTEKNGLYSLGKVDYQNYAHNQTRAKNLIVKADAITKYLKNIPWIELIALTGDAAAFNADKHADIDMLIVTKPRRLFLSRFFLVVILKLLGVYWTAKNPAGKVCPNIFMTSDAMTWAVKNQNLYTANEVSLLYPLYSCNDCYFSFLAQNSWICEYLPNFAFKINPKSADDVRKSQKINALINLVEFVARKSQMSHMRKKRTKEIIANNFLHFNIHDRTPDIVGKFLNSKIGV